MERTGLLESKQSAPRNAGWKASPWLLELGALLLSSSALVAAVAILASQQGKPVTEWKFPASINTVIAVLGAINKATLAFAVSACIGQHKWNLLKVKRCKLGLFGRFDEASRGPWGSMALIIKTRLRGWENLGALVLVISLALDPFLQAAVTLSGKVTPVDGSPAPSLPDGQKIDMGRLIPTKKTDESWMTLDPIMDTFRQEFDLGLTSAIYDGLGHSVRTSTSDPKVPFQCSTGNCTWPIFTSPAVCTTCNDVTSALVKDQSPFCASTNGSDETTIVGIGSESTCTGFWAGYGRIRQHDGPLRDEGLTVDDIMAPTNRSFSVLLTANITMNYTRTISFKDSKTLFLSYLVMRASDEFVRKETDWEDSKPTATECGLYFCAKAFDSKVESGNLVEEQVGQWADRDASSWQMFPSRGTGAKEFMEKHASLDQMSYYLTDLVVSVPEDDAQEMGVASRFNITQATVRGLQDSLKDITMETTTTVDENGTLSIITRPIMFPMSSTSTYNYPIGEILWNSTNLTASFDRLANRLTVELRSSLPSNLAGTPHLYVLHIRVQWPYLALPAYALTLGWAYLALVALQTRRAGLPVVKESVYPTLAYGFDEGTQAFLKMLGAGPRAALDLRDNLTIGLEDGKDGLRLEVAGNSDSAGRKGSSEAGVGASAAMEAHSNPGEDDQNHGRSDVGQLRRVGSAPAVIGMSM